MHLPLRMKYFANGYLSRCNKEIYVYFSNNDTSKEIFNENLNNVAIGTTKNSGFVNI